MTDGDGNWHWQASGSAWKGVGIYHVTIIVPSREPLLGKLIIPENDPKQAYIQRTVLGEALLECHRTIQSFHKEIQVLQYCLMPDHLHSVWYVRKPMKHGIMTTVRGFWQAAKQIGRDFSSVTPNDIRENERKFPIFTQMPFVRPMSRRGQLQTMIRYVQMNPQRLAIKRLMPDLFWVQDGIEIAGRTYKGVGNADLLQRARYMPVHVRRTMVEDAEKHGDDRQLRKYMNDCVLAARQGTVMVSPFISEYEQAVMAVLLKEGLPFIYIADNGFREYYKPQDNLFDAVARKQVLILSPWEYDPKMARVSRARYVEMNKMAEDICTMSVDPQE